MSNDYFNNTLDVVPGNRIGSQQIVEQFDAIENAFDLLPDLVSVAVANVKKYGAVGDGTTNDTAAIQTAIDTGLPVYLPKTSAFYLITGKLRMTTSGQRFYGDGITSQIRTSHLTQDVFEIGDGTNDISGLVFEDFVVWATVNKSAGHVFNCRFVSDSVWRNVRAGSIDLYVANGSAHRLYDGFYFDRFSQTTVLGGEVVVAHAPVKARGNLDQSFGAELSFDDGLRVFHASQPGFRFGGGTGGTYLGRVDVSECGGGVLYDKTLTAVMNRESFLSVLCAIDLCTDSGIEVVSDGLETLDAKGWISGCGTATKAAVRIVAATAVNAGGLRVQSSPYDGIHIDGAAWTQASGLIRSNGTDANGGHGINFVSGRLTLGTVSVHSNGDGTRGYGVNIGGAADNYNIRGSDFFSNGQGAISAGAAVSVTQQIDGNIGWVTKNSGAGQIANGTSSAAVTHGLSDTPTHITYGWAGVPDVSQMYAAPGDVGATTFTIRTTGNVTSSRDFWWKAFRGPV